MGVIVALFLMLERIDAGAAVTRAEQREGHTGSLGGKRGTRRPTNRRQFGRQDRLGWEVIETPRADNV